MTYAHIYSRPKDSGSLGGLDTGYNSCPNAKPLHTRSRMLGGKQYIQCIQRQLYVDVPNLKVVGHGNWVWVYRAKQNSP